MRRACAPHRGLPRRAGGCLSRRGAGRQRQLGSGAVGPPAGSCGIAVSGSARLLVRSASRRCGHQCHHPGACLEGRPAEYGRTGQRLDPRLLEHAARARHRRALHPSGPGRGPCADRGNVVVVTPTASGKTLCYNLPVLRRCCTIRRRGALPLSHQSVGPRPTAEPARRPESLGWRMLVQPTTATRLGPVGPTVRRHAQPVSPTPICCTWASCPTTPDGRDFSAAALCRHRRDAHLSRHLWQPRGQRAAPPGAHLPLLRQPSALYLLLGHHRQPRGTGREADGQPVAW